VVKEKYLLGMDAVRFFRLRYSAVSRNFGLFQSPERNQARSPGGPDRSEVELIEIVSESMIWIR
jgi:hypothetical protein